METILSHLDSLDCNVDLTRVDYRPEYNKWRCQVSRHTEEINLEAKAEGSSAYSALSKVYNTFLKAMNNGVDFAGLIEPPRAPEVYSFTEEDKDLPAF